MDYTLACALPNTFTIRRHVVEAFVIGLVQQHSYLAVSFGLDRSAR